MTSNLKFGLEQDVIEKINSVLSTYSQIKKAVIYGSRAKGNFKPGSDIDICLIAPDFDFTDFLSLQNELDDLLLPYKIDLALFHQIDNTNLIEHIGRVGVPFYSKSELH